MRTGDFLAYRTVPLGVALAATACVSVFAGSAAAQTTTRCAASAWSVTGGTADEHRLICEGVDQTSTLLESCGITRSEPMDMVVVPSLVDFCGSEAHAVFDSRDKTIRIAPLDVCASQKTDKDLFQFVSPDAAYRSVAAHEAAHAILDANGMRPEQWVANEYVAAVSQFSSIPPQERERLILSVARPGTVSDSRINAMYYALAPLRFAANSWLHYSELPDHCAFLNDLVSGEYAFAEPPL